MRDLKLLLLGIAVLLFGICAALLAGLGIPGFSYGEYETMTTISLFVGLGLAVLGFVWREED